MKKRTILCAIMFFVLCVAVYTENQPRLETVRYYDRLVGGYVVVRAVPIAWLEMYQTISSPGTSSARALTYFTFRSLDPNAQWSDWELWDNVPLPNTDFGDIRSAYSTILEGWRTYPNTGVGMTIKHFNCVRIYAVPNGRSTPCWFDDKGNLHIFWKLYAIDLSSN